ncbi:hypothetical protein K0U00_27325, partial [Paenibacillus sepulcri]|nr:hypothetical protein [Paenibacillus sepulcri]
VAAIGEMNQDSVVLANADFAKLRDNRIRGAVAPYQDRRPELYAELRKGHAVSTIPLTSG